MPKIMSVGPTAAAGEPVTDAKTEGRIARKYIMMVILKGTSRGPAALRCHLNYSSHKRVLVPLKGTSRGPEAYRAT